MVFEVLEAPVERDAQGAGRKAGPNVMLEPPLGGGSGERCSVPPGT